MACNLPTCFEYVGVLSIAQRYRCYYCYYCLAAEGDFLPMSGILQMLVDAPSI